jgi:hypothetical protein
MKPAAENILKKVAGIAAGWKIVAPGVAPVIFQFLPHGYNGIRR